jgi:hypothetical protein
VFSDLAVRSGGLFKLKFSVFDLRMALFRSRPLSSALSSTFQVYSPKTFPGVIDITDLSRCFAKQGIKIRIRSSTNKVADEDE